MILFRKISFWIALVGVALAVNMVMRLGASLKEPILPPPVTPAARPYLTAIAASGLVEARSENTHIGVPIAGLVTEVHVKVWDRVEKGMPLLQLDDRDLRASLATLQANVAVAEATLQRAETPLARMEELHRRGAITDDELDARRNDVKVADAQLGAARAAVAQTEALINRLTVRAPISGTILQVNVRAGEYASVLSTSAPIILGNIEELQLRADVDEQIAPRVQPGKKAIGYLKGDNEHPITMEFVRIEPFVVPKRSLTGASIERVDTRVLQVIYRFANNPERPVYVGQQMDIYIEN